ncbi:MAG: hypothetical protein IKV22_04005, partial [Paludibacteraceae bacterium]|nr:hypothetical protein [Paludibacteraceae bacterium]
MTKQEAVIKYIEDNYLQNNRLRHDVIADKLQIRIADSLENASLRAPQKSVDFSGTPLQNAPEGLQFRGKEMWREMTKHDINSIVCRCAQEYDANITSREVMTALQSDLIPDVHPLREYVLSCGEWTEEQPDWIDFVASQVRTADNAGSGVQEFRSSGVTSKHLNSKASELPNISSADRLWRGCFKKWFVAMVASWMKDEVVNHQVLVLIGRQGIYKTTWLEHLIPPHLRAYACKLANSNDLNKDERLRIAEFGLISLDEIDSMNNRELNQLKSIITATDINERAAYAYTKERRIRLASFCASGNRRDFLTDITGNRRWLPFEVESILNPFHTILPYDQLYAQAWALAQDPLFSYWFDLDEIEVLEEHNQHFRDESNEEQLLPILFDVPAEGRGEFMTTAQISERLVTYGNIKKPMALGRLGVLMGSMGYRSVTRGNRQARLRGWIVYQRDTEEIAANKKLLAKEC